MPAYINASPNASNNYTYTQIGELKSDNQEEISEIHWRVDSKISEIVRTSGSAKKNLKFEYDAMGNRVAKHVYAGSVLESSTYYVRDAQGNVMGVYEHKMDAENAVMEYKLIERNIYGSAQVGICKDTVDLNITNASGSLTQATYYHARQLNHRQYSLSNHLGNVLTTLGDGKAPVDSNSDGVIDYFTAYIISVSDYSPFGVELADRTWSIEEYRSGFNGKEKVTEITGNSSDYDFGARVYDARLGKFLSIDPKVSSFPSISPNCFAANNPILFIDYNGNGPKVAIIIGTEGNSDFEQHVSYLKSQGYDIIYAETGQKVLEELRSRAANGDVPIENLNILSHGYEEYGIIGNMQNSGIYTDDGFVNAIKDQAMNNAYSDDEDNENARNYVEQNAISALTISVAVENGEIEFANNATIALFGCNLGMQKEVVEFKELRNNEPPPLSLAEELSSYIGVSVIASSKEIRVKSNGVKYESSGYTSPADEYRSEKERIVEGDWIKFNPDGSQEKIGEKKINIATYEGY